MCLDKFKIEQMDKEIELFYVSLILWANQNLKNIGIFAYCPHKPNGC